MKIAGITVIKVKEQFHSHDGSALSFCQLKTWVTFYWIMAMRGRQGVDRMA
jgi:hypothetical protein